MVRSRDEEDSGGDGEKDVVRRRGLTFDLDDGDQIGFEDGNAFGSFRSQSGLQPSLGRLASRGGSAKINRSTGTRDSVKRSTTEKMQKLLTFSRAKQTHDGHLNDTAEDDYDEENDQDGEVVLDTYTFSLQSDVKSAPDVFSGGTLQSTPSTRRSGIKLEVIRAKEVERLFVITIVMIAVAVVYAAGTVALGNTVFLHKELVTYNDVPKEGDSRTVELRIAHQSDAVVYLNSAIYIVSFVIVFLAFCAFSFRILMLPRSERVYLQWWSVMQLLAAVLLFEPTDAIEGIIDTATVEGLDFTVAKQIVETIFELWFAIALIMYPWAVAATFRVARDRTKLPVSLWLPKLCATLVLSALKIVALWVFKIRFSSLPLISFFAMLYLFGETGVWQARATAYISTVTLLEVVIIAWFLYTFQCTTRYLRSVSYMRTRANQVAFRFFRWHTVNFFLGFYVCYFFLIFGWPSGTRIDEYFGQQAVNASVMAPVVSLFIMTLSYFMTQAWGNLPADSVGFRGWLLKPRELEPESLSAQDSQQSGFDVAAAPRALTYRARAVRSNKTGFAKVRPECFVMEEQVLAFNFAWLAYSYRKLDFSEVLARDGGFVPRAYLEDAATDTHALVVQGDTRIVLSFRGTSSLRNVQTDININMVEFEMIRPDTHAHRVRGRKCMVHRGFFESYMSIRTQLLDQTRRCLEEGWLQGKRLPLYLTGHSMGGALAVLAAVDVALEFGLGANDLCVSTFGAPRVGNVSFAAFYEAHVRNHWRICNVLDVVPTLPRVGYKHVGLKAAFNEQGELFLDPSGLEVRGRNVIGQGSWVSRDSFMWHRKSFYLLVMQIWCEKQHGVSYEPPFWPWPIKEEDHRRVAAAGAVSSLISASSTRRVINSDTVAVVEHLVALVIQQRSSQAPLTRERIGATEQRTEATRSAHSRWDTLVRKVLVRELIADPESTPMSPVWWPSSKRRTIQAHKPWIPQPRSPSSFAKLPSPSPPPDNV
mmetsp:Transcript_14477/g.31133  ORF Transcript_14477/g.31133 Transcript_14477/m.31133 type:complete len:987 (+) Transcript_14477:159-3119(+)|eukprot:CAMPEP_0185856958 /NCGR_PEP_ID=MMETSP1354-20130828/29259_1 /TAXON_ID=708628 /ORGANISM="Erythrolobus madagascarensis, Strain CCMP3276" /LENGTH=986 /DNA_ID=CAMNT_0028559219 /DNA_START=150 /DNA_END=3110 /DNA_ORIENTATION=-